MFSFCRGHLFRPSKDPRGFSNTFGVSIDPASYGPHARLATSFLASDPPEHTRMRGLVSRGFTPRRVRELEPRIREIAVEHLDRLVGAGDFDAVAESSRRRAQRRSAGSADTSVRFSPSDDASLETTC